MQADAAARFEREYGCTESEWRRWMPEAVHGHALAWQGPPQGRSAGLRVILAAGSLQLEWSVLPPRRIALISLPRLAVRFHYVDVPATVQAEFQRRFDLHLQRGGG